MRDVEKANESPQFNSKVKYRTFDFENEQTHEEAFFKVDILFLLRPPHISDVDKYFKPLLERAKNCDIENVVFLSVQGAEKSKVIPHNKIEHLIKALGF